jgi:hypothetical protein
MSGFTFRPISRVNTPLIIGIAGATKSGKTYSALRLANGLADGGPVLMINAEGPRGHQYADTFTYLGCDIEAPYRATRYTEALKDAAKLNPGAVIIDSGSHMHDGPGGALEWHEEIVDRIAGKTDFKARQRATFTGWVEPKAAANQFIYQMLSMKCPLILAFRAKEKIKIVSGKEPIDLGWQPIVDERVAFETMFTLMLTPHCKGVPDLDLSDMREPFDKMVPKGQPIDETLGRKLAEWARGGVTGRMTTNMHESGLLSSGVRAISGSGSTPADQSPTESADALLDAITKGFAHLKSSHTVQVALWQKYAGEAPFLSPLTDVSALDSLLADLRTQARRSA